MSGAIGERLAARENITMPLVPWPVVQYEIEAAVRVLLPRAVRNDATYPNTSPLRWHESRMQGAADPFNIHIWASLNRGGTDDVAITRILPTDRAGRDRLWGCVVTQEALPDQEMDYMTTSVGISTKGVVAVNRAHYKRRPGRPKEVGDFVGGEFDFELSDERRAQLLCEVGAALIRAVTETPKLQRDYFDDAGLDPAPFTFERLGAAASKRALGPVLQLFGLR